MENIASLNILLAFLFGMLSFFSPCILPLLPGYLSFIVGADITSDIKLSRRQAVWNSTGFIVGFSILFIGMGAAASSVGQWLAYNQDLLKKVAGVIIIIFGLHISELIPIKALYRDTRRQSNRRFTGWLGALILGLSFAAGWTPCIGPVLASILLLAGSSDTLSQGVTLLTFFSLGLAIPFMVAALGINVIVNWLTKLNKILPYVNAVSGGLLIAMGILLLLGIWDKLVLIFY